MRVLLVGFLSSRAWIEMRSMAMEFFHSFLQDGYTLNFLDWSWLLTGVDFSWLKLTFGSIRAILVYLELGNFDWRNPGGIGKPLTCSLQFDFFSAILTFLACSSEKDSFWLFRNNGDFRVICNKSALLLFHKMYIKFNSGHYSKKQIFDREPFLQKAVHGSPCSGPSPQVCYFTKSA